MSALYGLSRSSGVPQRLSSNLFVNRSHHLASTAHCTLQWHPFEQRGIALPRAIRRHCKARGSTER